MSNTLFPTLRGLTWEYTLSPTFSTGIQQATSGREVRASFWSGPLWKMSLTYEFLRDDTRHIDGNGTTELYQLVSFFLARQGSFDSFLLDQAQLTKKKNETQISGQFIGTGDGATVSFQLVRNVGGIMVPVQEPAGQQAAVYLNGALQSPSNYSIVKGVVTFAAAPTAGVFITADFQWLWRVRFLNDSIDFSNFMYLLWDCKQVDLIEVRQ